MVSFNFWVVTIKGKCYIHNNQYEANDHFDSLSDYDRARSYISYPANEEQIKIFLKHAPRKVLFFDRWFWWLPNKKRDKDGIDNIIKNHKEYLTQ